MPTLSAGVLQRSIRAALSSSTWGSISRTRRCAAAPTLNAPRLRDALRTALATYAGTYYRDRTAPDPSQVSRLMQQAVDRTLGAPGARVLLANIIYQQRAAELSAAAGDRHG